MASPIDKRAMLVRWGHWCACMGLWLSRWLRLVRRVNRRGARGETSTSFSRGLTQIFISEYFDDCEITISGPARMAEGTLLTQQNKLVNYIMSKSSELLDYISKLNYTGRRKFILRDQRARIERETAEDKKPTRFLYKYLGVSDPMQKERTRSLIVESKLRFSSPASFNDPFDMKWRTAIEGTPQQKRERLLKVMATNPQTAMRGRGRNEVEVSRILANPESFIEGVNKAGLEASNKAGVLSLTSEVKSILMWSHYGEHHTGIALQFEIAKDPKYFLPAVAVRYSNEYPVRNWVDESCEDLRGGLYGKFKDWEYEKERRIIYANFANNYLQYKPIALTGIILGFCFNESEWLNSALRDREKRNGKLPLKIYRAIQSSHSYRLAIIDDNFSKKSITKKWDASMSMG